MLSSHCSTVLERSSTAVKPRRLVAQCGPTSTRPITRLINDKLGIPSVPREVPVAISTCLLAVFNFQFSGSTAPLQVSSSRPLCVSAYALKAILLLSFAIWVEWVGHWCQGKRCLFLPGTPHAYLRGTGVEVMATRIMCCGLG